jgi:hypothetical protein
MHKALSDLPVFDPATFRGRTADWKKIIQAAATGGNRVVIEWGIMRGPNCFVYPATRRGLGINLMAAVPHNESDERWADYLEFEYLPQVLKALQDDGLNPQVICVDLRPIQIQRGRRRAIEVAARAKSGVAAHH